jgi:hypothetical protein
MEKFQSKFETLEEFENFNKITYIINNNYKL